MMKLRIHDPYDPGDNLELNFWDNLDQVFEIRESYISFKPMRKSSLLASSKDEMQPPVFNSEKIHKNIFVNFSFKHLSGQSQII